MAEEPLWQAGDKGMRGDSLALTRPHTMVGEIVHLWGAGAIAGEMEGEQAQQAGAVIHIIGRKVKIRRDSLPPLLGAGPFLAQQRALMRQLPHVAVGKTHAMAGGEE